MRKKILNYSILGLVFLLPLFFLPLMADFYAMPKNFLLIFTAVTAFCLWFADKLISRKFKFSSSPFDLPVLLFCVVNIVSTLIASPNKMESLLMPGGTGTIIALTLLYFVIKNNVKSITQLLNYLITSASLLALLSFYQFLGIGEEIAPFEWMKPKFWTPTGSLLALTVFLVVGLVIAVMKFKEKSGVKQQELSSGQSTELSSNELKKPPSGTARFFSLTAIVVLLLGIATALYQLFTTQKLVMLPYSTGWAIAVEGFKNLKTGLFGVGPANFISAFTRFRPIAFNNTEVWNARFTYSSNLYLQLLTEVGLLGLLSFLFIVYKVLTRHATRDTRHAMPYTLSYCSILFCLQI